MSSNLQLTRLK